MSISRYAQYKHTGYDWPPEIPRDWDLGRLKDKVLLMTKKSESDNNPVALENVESWTGRLVETETAFEGDGIDFRPGDILFGKLRPYLAKIYLADSPGEAVGDFFVMRPDATVYGRFLQYQMLTREFISIIESSTSGAKMPRASWDFLGSMPLACPSLPEQQAIAAFLDRETAKIDGLVTAQHRLIGLLNEKRQAIVAHAVTKGLNPGAPMKQSGVEWLGRVPEHWQVVRNKVLFKEVDQRTATDEGELLTVSHLTGVTPRAEKNVNMIMAETLEGYKKCLVGDLVINTMWAWMGAMGISPCDGLVSPSYNVYRVRSDELLSTAFYDYLCRTSAHVATVKARSTGVWESRLRLYPEAFLDLCSPVPPLTEQAAIVARMDEELAKFNALMAEAQSGIRLLQERRTALVSAAVSGKIDIRAFETASTLKRVAAA